MRAGILGLLFFVSTAIVAAKDAEKKLPAPDAAGVAKGQKTVQDVIGPQIERAKTPTSRRMLAAKLLLAANDTKEVVENRWVLYLRARDLAANIGDFPLTMQIVDDMFKTFSAERADIIAETAEKLSKTLPPTSAKSLFDLLEKTAEKAIQDDDYKNSIRLYTVGTRAVKQTTRDPLTTKHFDMLLQRATLLAKEYTSAVGVDENMGKFLCFRKGEWAKGLPLLVNSSDNELVFVVKKDLMNPTESRERAILGDSWLELAEKAKGYDKVGYQRRSYHWLRLAFGDLSGLEMAKLEGKLTKLAEAIEAADAKEYRFTLYEGRWSNSYESPTWSATFDYTILSNGEATISNSKDRDGKKSTIARKNGVTYLMWDDGAIVEKIRCVGNTLVLERFWTKDYPNRVHATGVATYKP